MKNTDLIAAVGGIEKARGIVAGAPNHAQVSIPCLDGVMYFSKRNDGKWFKWSDGYSQWLEYFGRVDPMDLAIELDDLRTAIAEHDRAVGEREFKVGDLVVKSGSIHFKSKSFSLWIINRVMQTTIPCLDVTPLSKRGKPVHSGNQVAANQQFRHATPAEIKAGHRIDRALTGGSDDVSDIAYHVGPLTKVQCHHQWISGDVLGNTEHQYFCTYCGEKKTEAFGVKHESN